MTNAGANSDDRDMTILLATVTIALAAFVVLTIARKQRR
jgi:hypothetical protein